MVLLADCIHIETADPSEASNGAARTVLALVAMDHNRMVGAVHDQTKSTLHFAGVNADLAFVCADVDLEVLDSGVVHEGLVLRRNGLGHQCKDTLDFEVLDELVVGRVRVAATVDASRDDGAIVCGGDAHREAIGYYGPDRRRSESASFGR